MSQRVLWLRLWQYHGARNNADYGANYGGCWANKGKVGSLLVKTCCKPANNDKNNAKLQRLAGLWLRL